MPHVTSGSSPLDQLLSRLMIFQRKNRYVGSAWKRLRIVEQQLLTELDSPTPSRATDLSWRLQLPLPHITHIVSSLRGKGLVIDYPFSLDKREGRITLTKKGLVKVREADELSNCLMHDFARPLTNEKQRALHKLFTTLTDGLGCPPSICRPGEHPLRVETRRLTRALGIVTRDFAGTGYSNAEVQALYFLREQRESTKEMLREAFQLSQSAITRTITSLGKRGVVASIRKNRSSTKQLLALTEAGAALLRLLDQKFGRMFLEACGATFGEQFRETLSVIDQALRDWNTNLLKLPSGIRVATDTNYFETLISQALIFHTSNQSGILLRPEGLTFGKDTWAGYDGSTIVMALSIAGDEITAIGVNESKNIPSGIAVHFRTALKRYLIDNKLPSIHAHNSANLVKHHLALSDNQVRRQGSSTEIPLRSLT